MADVKSGEKATEPADPIPPPSGGNRALAGPRLPSWWAYGFFFLIVLTGTATASWWANERDSSHHLSTVVLLRSDLSGARLVAADLSGVRFVAVTLSGSDLTNSNLRSADFSGSEGSQVQFVGACLRDSVWDGANLTEVNFDRADLRGADMRRVEELAPSSAVGALYDDDTEFPDGKPFAGSTDSADEFVVPFGC